jgi:hypothetical protein
MTRRAAASIFRYNLMPSIAMFDFVDFILGLVGDILLALVPTSGKNRHWYLIIACLILLACSLCAFLAQAVVQARS